MRAPQATGAPAPQGPRNEGEIQQAAGWQATMYGSHGMAFGNNPAVIRQQSSANSGGQKTGHPDKTNDDAFNSHGEHGDNSLGASGGALQAQQKGFHEKYAGSYGEQSVPSVDYKRGGA